MSLDTPLEPAAVGSPAQAARSAGGDEAGMNRVRRKGEAVGMGVNALVLTTIRCTSGRERNAVASMGGRDPR